MKPKRRSSYLRHHIEDLELGTRGLTIWAYSGNARFICRLWVNSAGVAVYSGRTGKKRLANVTWERLVEKLAKKKN